MTDAERKLWFALRDRRFANFKFRRQASIGPFIADFVCYDARVVIEVDGGQHADSKSDARRDRWFAANDFRVLRFWNNDVLSNPEGVLTSILSAMRNPSPGSLPGPRDASVAGYPGSPPSPAGGEGQEPAP